ncbi:uncharacterized protein LOC131436033 [Malaya genurostris]|uniref:uncharacterized protein LOC131436033 n=1 Tax=Malaya genurostris TaxID=325434 RepID=UPI0026F3ABE2|nr:uncharacterized protein LOC131436033 [Malaya genurostris]
MVLLWISIKIDYNYKMLREFEQSLDTRRFELNSFRHYGRSNRVYADVGEIIDITGDQPSKPESIDHFQSNDPSYLMQPTSKIYYDNLEKEYSDGGFFDRDELEDEDEKDDLVIDCKVNGDVGENKTENGISHDSKGKHSTLTESEIVLNFTLVDKKLIYNESTIIRKLPYASGTEVEKPGVSDVIHANIPIKLGASSIAQGNIQVEVVAPNKSSARIPAVIQDKHTPSQTSNQEDIRLHQSDVSVKNSVPYHHVNTSGNHTKHLRTTTAKYHSQTNVPTFVSISNKSRSSALQASQLIPQMAHLKAAIGPNRILRPNIGTNTRLIASPQKQQSIVIPQRQSFTPVGRYAKFSNGWRKPNSTYQSRSVSEGKAHVGTSSCLPPQFGFGSSMLSNLYDATQPLDLSKNSPLSQLEAMLKRSPQDQHRYGHFILRSMPIPDPPKPPSSALRPKLVSIRHHPTISRVHQPNKLHNILISKPHPPTKRPHDVDGTSFQVHVRQEIDEFFKRRQNEICSALKLFNTETIDVSELFRRLDHNQIRISRDYLGIAWTMIHRYGYRFRPEVPPVKLNYRWSERPQEITEYFTKVRATLQPHASQETLNIYRMVIGGLLEQFRDSIEHFLARNLQW